MDKMKFETPNLTAENLKKLSELFPGVVTEGKVNVDLLRSYVGEEIFKDEAYEFTWVGKRAAIAEAGRPIRKTLRPVVEDEITPTGVDSTGKPYCSSGSKDWDTTENLYIEGDNLDVLKLLQESYLGRVKMIYIDPPYNTGNDFVYRDNFTQSREEYEDEIGVVDEDGDRLFKNTETNGRFHSDWCSMMYPRLVLARNMLRDDGVIFISIDDNEVAQLRKICDEVFGEENALPMIIRRCKIGGGSDNKQIAKEADFVISYSKSIQETPVFSLPHTQEDLKRYSQQDEKGYFFWDTYSRAGLLIGDTESDSLYYEVTFPNGTKFANRWRRSKERLEQDLATGEAKFVQTQNGWNIHFKQYLNSEGKRPRQMLYDGFGNPVANEDLKSVKLGKCFDYPKPVKLISHLANLLTEDNDIVLDFFSGSATTAHAVMQLNAEDGGKRKFIMVQLPEVCAEGTEAAKAGYKNICEIGKERIRRAGDKIKAENKDKPGIENLDIGFRVLKLDDTNMNEVYYAAGDYTQDMLFMMESNIKPDRNDMDLLFGCLLDWGLPLSMPHTHEKIDGFTVHTYNDGDLIACFEERISEKAIREIANRQPLRAVFRDSSFSSSPEKINVFEIFKLLAPNTSVKVI